MLTPNQIKWASKHDWYICLDPAQEGAIIVDDHWTQSGPDADEIISAHKQRSFDTFSELYVWAGY